MDCFRHSGENELARELSDEVIRVSTDFDRRERWPMRIAEAQITLGVVAAREGDLDEAVSRGRRALAGDRKLLPPHLLTCDGLARPRARTRRAVRTRTRGRGLSRTASRHAECKLSGPPIRPFQPPGPPTYWRADHTSRHQARALAHRVCLHRPQYSQPLVKNRPVTHAAKLARSVQCRPLPELACSNGGSTPHQYARLARAYPTETDTLL